MRIDQYDVSKKGNFVIYYPLAYRFFFLFLVDFLINKIGFLSDFNFFFICIYLTFDSYVCPSMIRSMRIFKQYMNNII